MEMALGKEGTISYNSWSLQKEAEVLAVEAVGLCHSDVAQLNGQKHVPGEISPTVPGHEIVGRVHALDSNAELGVEIGDRVAVNIVVPTEPTDSNPFGFSCYGYSFSLEDSEGFVEAMGNTCLFFHRRNSNL